MVGGSACEPALPIGLGSVWPIGCALAPPCPDWPDCAGGGGAVWPLTAGAPAAGAGGAPAAEPLPVAGAGGAPWSGGASSLPASSPQPAATSRAAIVHATARIQPPGRTPAVPGPPT